MKRGETGNRRGAPRTRPETKHRGARDDPPPCNVQMLTRALTAARARRACLLTPGANQQPWSVIRYEPTVGQRTRPNIYGRRIEARGGVRPQTRRRDWFS